MVDYRVGASLGERIQSARKQRGIRSTRALADLIGNGSVTESILQNIETGRLTNISLSQLLNIAHALRVAPSLLLVPLGRPEDPVDLPHVSLGIASMSAAEFDSWFTGQNTGSYRPASAHEMAERNELAAWRDLQQLKREQTRLSALADIDTADPLRQSPQPLSRLEQVRVAIAEIQDYLDTAGWPRPAS